MISRWPYRKTRASRASRAPATASYEANLMACSLKSAAVCRAGRRDGCSRCAVRMTARGSVTPGMACGSRPVKDIPQPGAFPTVGINPGQGSRGHGLMPPCRPRQAAGWQIAQADSGRNGPDVPANDVSDTGPAEHPDLHGIICASTLAGYAHCIQHPCGFARTRAA